MHGVIPEHMSATTAKVCRRQGCIEEGVNYQGNDLIKGGAKSSSPTECCKKCQVAGLPASCIGHGHANGHKGDRAEGHVSGHVYGHAEGRVEGHVAGHVYMHVDGHVDEHVDGQVDAYADGHVYEHVHGHAYGHMWMDMWMNMCIEAISGDKGLQVLEPGEGQEDLLGQSQCIRQAEPVQQGIGHHAAQL